MFPAGDSASFHTGTSGFSLPRTALCQESDSELRFLSTVRWGSPWALTADLEQDLLRNQGKSATVMRLMCLWASQSFFNWREQIGHSLRKAVRVLDVYCRDVSIRGRWPIVCALKENSPAKNRKSNSNFEDLTYIYCKV